MKTVVTTINEPSKCLKKFSKKHDASNKIIIIGDEKGPSIFNLENCEFYPLDVQLKLPFSLSKLLPTAHYSRKNLGYLIAIQQGEECIYETDDDNEPNQFWQKRDKQTKAVFAEKSSWINVYRHFSSDSIWPRGFLLEKIIHQDSVPRNDGILQEVVAPIQQGLADVSPDVDALWRLTQDREFHFNRNESIALPEGAWCPFNTQSTWWWKEAFPLLYLPSYCSFRMTDIWKSFVAQRCLWEMGYKLVFHAPEVNQERNFHNLMHDFEFEIPGYTLNGRIIQILEEINLLPHEGNTLKNLILCYESLVKNKIFPKEELVLVNAWVRDVENVTTKPKVQKA